MIFCMLLWQADEFLVSQLSFAPEAELPNFAMKTRSAMKHIRDHPFPAVTVFPDNRPRYFRKDESGAWVQVRYWMRPWKFRSRQFAVSFQKKRK